MNYGQPEAGRAAVGQSRRRVRKPSSIQNMGLSVDYLYRFLNPPPLGELNLLNLTVHPVGIAGGVVP